MKKTVISLLFSLVYLFLPSSVFADGNSLIEIGDILTRKDLTVRDITAQIQLREAEIRANNAEIRYRNLQIIRIIERDNLNWWQAYWNVEIHDYKRQISSYERLNRRYTREINRLNREL